MKAAAKGVLASDRLCRPQAGTLVSIGDPEHEVSSEFLSHVDAQMRQRDYPCVAALRSFYRDEYLVGLYTSFGTTVSASDLRKDLVYFLSEVRRTDSEYLTMWAVFRDAEPTSEIEFENKMWSQLSSLTSIERRTEDWGPRATAAEMDPTSPSFSFRIEGESMFVVGLHPNSSRRGRAFPFTALVFNAFSQFERIERQGGYERMVATNRARDTRFAGAPNPMCLAYGEKWEAIQFSGRANEPSWTCPFSWIHEQEGNG